MTTIVFTFDFKTCVGSPVPASTCVSSPVPLSPHALVLSAIAAENHAMRTVVSLMEPSLRIGCDDRGACTRHLATRRACHVAATLSWDPRGVTFVFLLAIAASCFACKARETGSPSVNVGSAATPVAPHAAPPSESAFYATTFARQPPVPVLTELGRKLFLDP